MKLTEQQISELKWNRELTHLASSFLRSYILRVSKSYGAYSGMVEDYLYGNVKIEKLIEWMDDHEDN